MSIAKTMGRLLAVAGDDEQAELLNAAGEMQRRMYSEGREMQTAYIVDKLTVYRTNYDSSD
jgi:hypothetical protein